MKHITTSNDDSVIAIYLSAKEAAKLIEILGGFMITRQGSARQVLEPLLRAFLIDAFESDESSPNWLAATQELRDFLEARTQTATGAFVIDFR